MDTRTTIAGTPTGGIRTAAHLLEMVDAGANRIGTSAGVAIVEELGAPRHN